MKPTIPEICPRCGCCYVGYPAISRVDNETPICPDCGLREALTMFGISPKEQDDIIETLHKGVDP